MKNYTNIAIVASFFVMADSFFNLQVISGFIFILPLEFYGANDLLLIKNIKSKHRSNSSLKILYTISSSFIRILFYIVPEVALLLFIL
jgi:hypothetical protein